MAAVPACRVALLAALTTALIYKVNGQLGSLDPLQDPTRLSRINPDPTYFISIPRRVRPGQILQVSVTIMKLLFPHMNVRVSVIEGQTEVAFIQHRFERPSTQLLQLQIPATSGPGNYKVRAEGTLNGGVTGYVFEEEQEVIFDLKRMSVFIQTNRPFYKQGERVRFRVIPLTQDLMTAPGSMSIYIKDSTGYTVRRWLAQQTNAGVLSLSFQLSDQPRYGKWSIMVDTQGYSYTEYITVEEYWTPMFEVNVTTPTKMFDNDFGLQGVIVANHTSGIPARGNGTLTLEIRDLETSDPPTTGSTTSTRRPQTQARRVVRTIRYFSGVSNFLFTMDELQQYTNSLSNKEIVVHVTIYDWQTRWNVSGFSSTVVYGSRETVKWLGHQPQTFKPGLLYVTYLSVTMEDGSPIPASVRQQVTIEDIVTLQGGSVQNPVRHRLVVPDNGVVKFEYTPPRRAQKLEFRASYGNSDRKQILLSYRYFSISDSYIQVTTETENPRVNEYMVFTVRTNHFVDRLHYMVTAAGNLIMSDQLQMNYRQKTWSIAVSRQMAPSAHMVVYYMKEDGEVVADSLNFHVNISRLMNLKVEFNRGKDFTRRTAQMSAVGQPAAYVAFTGIYYDLYSRGARPFMTEERLMREMYTFDDHTTTSYMHTYQLPEEQTKLLIFPSTDQGQDTYQTFHNTGIIVFTDSNITRLEQTDQCKSQNQLPCRGGACYTEAQKCDGNDDCTDRTDELNCPEPLKPTDRAKPAMERFKHTERLFDDNNWAWKDQIIKANNRVDMTVDVPEYPLDWVVSAFSIHPYDGLAMLQTPYRFQPTRPFYMSVEYPEEMKQGEMLGIRIGVFNYWEQYIDCLVTLHASEDFEFIHVDEGGVVSQYRPRTSRADRHTLVNLLPGRTTYVFMPVVSTHTVGRKCVKISAATFIGGDEELACINIVPYGVENYYGTPYFVDLSSQGAMIVPRLNITVPELFIKPEQPYFEYVPYSPEATVSVYGDVVGSFFNKKALTSQSTVRKPSHGAEMVLYEMGVNMYTFIYLQRTNQLSNEQIDVAIDYINLVLQRALSFLDLKEGSFKPFRDNSNGSVWLTATAGKVLQLARIADQEARIYVDVDILNSLALWLVDERQNPITGAFYADPVAYDTKFASTDEKNITITAYVVLALDSMTSLSGDAAAKATSAKNLAADYLSKVIDDITDPFMACIVTYALHKVNNVQKNEVFKVMSDLKRTRDDMIYWANRDIAANRLTNVAARPYAEPRLWQANEAYAVQATSYAFLTYLQRNDIGLMTAIIRWLAEMRNYVNGFASTADTLVAIEALSEFARADQNHDTYNIIYTITNSDNSDWKVREALDRKNIGSILRVQLPRPHGFAEVLAQGTGYGLAHLAVTVNVEKDHQLVQPLLAPLPGDVPGTPYWQLYLGKPGQMIINFSGFNQSILEADVCARWLRTDLKPQSGQAVIEFELPTGYVAWNTELRRQVQEQAYNATSTLQHAQFDRNKIFLYYKYIDNQLPTCTHVKAVRWFPIANVSEEHELRVYDFFEPGLFTSTIYTTRSLFALDICLVCGSFECPYCPYYNSAPHAVMANLMLISVAVLCSVALVLGLPNCSIGRYKKTCS